jgi:hypothetical protein
MSSEIFYLITSSLLSFIVLSDSIMLSNLISDKMLSYAVKIGHPTFFFITFCAMSKLVIRSCVS